MKAKFLSAILLAMAAMPVRAQMPDAMQIAPKMYPGWNLGNTMEACPCTWLDNDMDWETGWQPTKTTQQIIDYVRDQGFRSVRIPVAWYTGHLVEGQNSVQIRPSWMARVREIVDYCIRDGLYVVLNDHWDGGWLENNISPYSASRAETLTQLWTQIAEEFRDYDEHLLFAGFNEPNADNQTATNALMRYAQVFVDAVRATGGNNAERVLVVQGPTTDIEKTVKMYSMPNDPAEGRLMVEVHYYTPYNFCMMTKDESWGNQAYFWGKANHVTDATYRKWNATWGEEDYLDDLMAQMYKKFGAKGYPVIIGEYGTIWRKLSNSAFQAKHDASIRLYHKLVNLSAIEHGCIPFVWDTNGLGSNSMDVINRRNRSVFNTHALEGIREGVAAAQWPATMMAIETIGEDCNATHGTSYNLMGQPAPREMGGLIIRDGRVCIERP